jgi:hypothetical protein
MSEPEGQIVLLPPGVRFYSVVCRRCLKQASPRHGYFGPILEGELPEGTPHLTTRCPRGHPITLVTRAQAAPGRRATSGGEEKMWYFA